MPKLNRSTGHTHTHTQRENNTPDTDTHAHDKNNTCACYEHGDDVPIMNTATIPFFHRAFGAATHPGVGGGTHRRRATVERC